MFGRDLDERGQTVVFCPQTEMTPPDDILEAVDHSAITHSSFTGKKSPYKANNSPGYVVDCGSRRNQSGAVEDDGEAKEESRVSGGKRFWGRRQGILQIFEHRVGVFSSDW
jgi:hypothetical protein